MRLFSSNLCVARSSALSTLVLLSTILSLCLGSRALAQSPCADTLSFLDTLSQSGGDVSLMYTGGFGAFFPKDSQYDGSAAMGQDFRCHILLHKDGDQIGRWPVLVRDAGKVFQRFQAFGSPVIHRITATGNYAYSVEFDGQVVTRIPFTLLEGGGSSDPFDPSVSYRIESDLLHWAQIEVDRSSSQATVGVQFRVRPEDFDLGRDADITVTVEQDGREIYAGGRLGRASISGAKGWRKFSKSLRYPEHQGGGFLPLEDFVKLDGTYRVVLRSHEGALLRAWEYVVTDGGIVPHPRSGFDHEPKSEYLLSRVPIPGEHGHRDLYWLEPLTDPDAGVDAPAAAPVASSATRSGWKPVVPVPERAPALVITGVATRVDAHLAAGEGIIVYGTGSNKGVAYLECGDDVEKSIPGGAEFSSGVFFVCGKKIVLLKRPSLAIFDTETGRMTELPAEDVTLLRSPTTTLKGRHIDADGMLVAVICDPNKTADRRSIKVIDLSASEPRIIALGFPDAAPSDLCSIAVDAAAGTLVVGSDRKNCLFTAPIAKDATFRAIDLSGHDGLPRDCAPIVRKGTAAIFDTTGTRKLRLVDLNSGSVRSAGPLGKALQWFAFDGERLALASDVSYGSSYEIRMGAIADGQPKAPAGAGESSDFGKVGYGQRVAMTGSGLVFASGSGKGGISTDEVLLASDGSLWHEIRQGGKAVPAVDGVLGTHILAFKTGKSRNARVGYVLLGKGMTGEEFAGHD